MPRGPATAAIATVSLLAAGLAGPAAAAAAPPLPPKHTGALAPSLFQFAKPSVRSLAAAPRARALGVAASGPGSLVRGKRGVLVEVGFSAGPAPSLSGLREAGATIVSSSGAYRTVTARVPASGLKAVAALPRVASVAPVRAPVLRASSCQGGSVISDGVAQLNVERGNEGARPELGLEGEGLTVGVLSDSLNQANEAVTPPGRAVATKEPQDIASKDLPGPTNTCSGQKTAVNDLMDYLQEPEGEDPFDEGRAMLQVVHDVAPKANLAFYSAFNGETAFAEGIEALARPTSQKGAGADVIADDVGYFEEPFFQDGPIAAAIDKVTSEGVTYLTAAGNDNLLDSSKDEMSSWEAPEYRDSGSCPGAVRELSGFNPHHCLDFDPGEPVDRTFGIRVEPEETLSVDLQWAEPWYGVETDLDAFLLNAQGELLTASTEANVSKSQEPVEIVQWKNESSEEKTVQLVVNKFLGSADPRLKFILLEDGKGVSATEYPVSGGGDVVGPSVYGHAGAAAAISVGAVPYNQSNQAEEYSSRGPVTHYFGPVEPVKADEEPTPAAPLLPPQVISKPDVAATDCGRTTFFAQEPKSEPGIWRFCGTSAAAPHAAGVAALMLQEDKTASPAEVGAALAGTGVPVGGFGACAVGGGLVEAFGAATALTGGPESSPAPCEYPDASGPVIRAPGDWGSEEPPPPQPESPPGGSTPPPAPKPPNTSFLKHPPKTVRTRGSKAKAVFRFGSDQKGVHFLCRIDKAHAFKACGPKLSRSFGLGKHVVRVKARSSAGLTDASAAVFSFRVRRVG